jgi:hypothetical protein
LFFDLSTAFARALKQNEKNQAVHDRYDYMGQPVQTTDYRRERVRKKEKNKKQVKGQGVAIVGIDKAHCDRKTEVWTMSYLPWLGCEVASTLELQKRLIFTTYRSHNDLVFLLIRRPSNLDFSGGWCSQTCDKGKREIHIGILRLEPLTTDTYVCQKKVIISTGHRL